jgi:hypothetical protein
MRKVLHRFLSKIKEHLLTNLVTLFLVYYTPYAGTSRPNRFPTSLRRAVIAGQTVAQSKLPIQPPTIPDIGITKALPNT